MAEMFGLALTRERLWSPVLYNINIANLALCFGSVNVQLELGNWK